jgi:hypothetical protein
MQLRRRQYIATTSGVLLAALVAWAALSGPMLINAKFGPMPADPRLGVWNPLRDRSPERYGSVYLRKIQSATCRQEAAGLQIADKDKVTACAKQSRIPLASTCRLVERSDHKSEVWLLYQCPYQDSSHMFAEVDIVLKHESDSWLLTFYERID